MPQNFPDMWLKRVEKNLNRGDRAPWLDGIEELPNDVQVMGEGEGEINLIYISYSDFEPDVLINNTTYPIDIQEYTEGGVVVNLDKYQTKATSVKEDLVIGGSYDKIDKATKSHTTAILKKKFSKAAHAMAPASNTTGTPVLKTTGRTGTFKANGDEIILSVGGRLRFTFLDLVDFKAACVKAGFDFEGNEVRLVLCDDHLLDLQADRKNFEALVSYKSGDPAPIILGFKIYSYALCPSYTTGLSKLAYGAVPTTGQYQASFAYWEGNVGKKNGFTRQYYDKPTTTMQAHLVNYRHYYLTLPKRNKYIAAITSGAAA